MREKTMRLVVTFHTTTEAMAAEAFFKGRDLPGRLIPVPRQVSAGCGLAWSAPIKEEEALVHAMGQAGIRIQGLHHLEL